MTAEVLQFAPNSQALENIPHMLRYWAAVIERDQKEGKQYELAAMVLVEFNNPKPVFCTFGDQFETPHHPLFVAGMFDACRRAMLQVGDE